MSKSAHLRMRAAPRGVALSPASAAASSPAITSLSFTPCTVMPGVVAATFSLRLLAIFSFAWQLCCSCLTMCDSLAEMAWQGNQTVNKNSLRLCLPVCKALRFLNSPTLRIRQVEHQSSKAKKAVLTGAATTTHSMSVKLHSQVNKSGGLDKRMSNSRIGRHSLPPIRNSFLRRGSRQALQPRQPTCPSASAAASSLLCLHSQVVSVASGWSNRLPQIKKPVHSHKGSTSWELTCHAYSSIAEAGNDLFQGVGSQLIILQNCKMFCNSLYCKLTCHLCALS